MRHFCRRCGGSLDEAAPVEVPWWRRLFFARRRVVTAGERPKRAGADGVGHLLFSLLKWGLAAIVLLALLFYALLPSVRTPVNDRVTSAFTSVRKQFFPHYDPVHPLTAIATSSIPGHTPDKAIDGIKQTYWAADITSDKEPVLILNFAQPTDLAFVLFTSGVPDNFQAQARPQKVHLVFSDGTSKDLTLRDEAKPQQHTIDARQVTRLEIHILTVYPSTQGTAVAVNEVEFWTRN